MAETVSSQVNIVKKALQFYIQLVLCPSWNMLQDYCTQVGFSLKDQCVVCRNERYGRWLKRAKVADLTPISSLRCLYQSGFDKYGRPVVVFVGKNFPATMVNEEKVLKNEFRILLWFFIN